MSGLSGMGYTLSGLAPLLQSASRMPTPRTQQFLQHEALRRAQQEKLLRLAMQPVEVQPTPGYEGMAELLAGYPAETDRLAREYQSSLRNQGLMSAGAALVGGDPRTPGTSMAQAMQMLGQAFDPTQIDRFRESRQDRRLQMMSQLADIAYRDRAGAAYTGGGRSASRGTGSVSERQDEQLYSKIVEQVSRMVDRDQQDYVVSLLEAGALDEAQDALVRAAQYGDARPSTAPEITKRGDTMFIEYPDKRGVVTRDAPQSIESRLKLKMSLERDITSEFQKLQQMREDLVKVPSGTAGKDFSYYTQVWGSEQGVPEIVGSTASDEEKISSLESYIRDREAQLNQRRQEVAAIDVTTPGRFILPEEEQIRREYNEDIQKRMDSAAGFPFANAEEQARFRGRQDEREIQGLLAGITSDDIYTGEEPALTTEAPTATDTQMASALPFVGKFEHPLPRAEWPELPYGERGPRSPMEVTYPPTFPEALAESFQETLEPVGEAMLVAGEAGNRLTGAVTDLLARELMEAERRKSATRTQYPVELPDPAFRYPRAKNVFEALPPAAELPQANLVAGSGMPPDPAFQYPRPRNVVEGSPPDTAGKPIYVSQAESFSQAAPTPRRFVGNKDITGWPIELLRELGGQQFAGTGLLSNIVEPLLNQFNMMPYIPPENPQLAGVPEEYRQFILSSAQEQNIPADVLSGLIETESNWNPGAVSPKGAIGLGQILPETARDFGVTEPELYDPQTNINLAARYLRWVMEYLGPGASLEDALAAYNAGVGNFQNENYLALDETMQYVPKVIRGARRYGYGGG